ncbi:MAG TPA: hypothetical protein VF158_17835 [Longimicrobiales bacterium]
MRTITAPRALLIAALLGTTGACARGVGVESEPGPAYALEVHNPMPHPMILSYDDGTGARLLGTVPPNGSARFVITRPASRQISLVATDEGRTHTIRRSATLRTQGVTEVSLGS